MQQRDQSGGTGAARRRRTEPPILASQKLRRLCRYSSGEAIPYHRDLAGTTISGWLSGHRWWKAGRCSVDPDDLWRSDVAAGATGESRS